MTLLLRLVLRLMHSFCNCCGSETQSNPVDRNKRFIATSLCEIQASRWTLGPQQINMKVVCN